MSKLAGADDLRPELWVIQRSFETRVYQSRLTFAKAIADGYAWTHPSLRNDPAHDVRLARYVLLDDLTPHANPDEALTHADLTKIKPATTGGYGGGSMADYKANHAAIVEEVLALIALTIPEAP